MTQEEIWEEHIKNTTVDNVLNEYNNPAIFQKELVEIIDAESNKGNSIIEVGCELGVTSMLLRDDLNKTLLDLNPLAIDLTKKAHELLHKKAQFVVANMFEMPFKDKSFDIVFNAGVIEHFNKDNRTKALKEYARVLKDEGIMYIAYPNHYSLAYRLAYIIRNIFHKWSYPSEHKIYDLNMEIKSCENLYLVDRVILSRQTIFNWLQFIPPLKAILQIIDKLYKFEGYLTVIKIRKR